jgi:hypothetical protein
LVPHGRVNRAAESMLGGDAGAMSTPEDPEPVDPTEAAGMAPEDVDAYWNTVTP